ncbi:MAG: hypothetical protein KF861_16305, partial [Planctomycetaceae bacterium]|nr:hypothetical protein [Planctomycetaceae bacterium]
MPVVSPRTVAAGPTVASPGHLLRGGGLVFGLRLAISGLMFGMQLIIARVLGLSEFGIYAYAMAWVHS